MLKSENSLMTFLIIGLLYTVSACSIGNENDNTNQHTQKNHIWHLATVFPPGNFHVKNLRSFAEEAKRITGGALDINVHDSGSLGLKGPEAISAVRDRIVDAAEASLEWQVGEIPLASISALPGLAVGYEETRILTEILRPHLDKILATHNQRILFLVPWQGQGVYSKYPIKTKMDLQGLKMRVASKEPIAFFEELGASPIQLPWSEVVPALASGLIVGVSTSSMSGVDGKFPEFMEHYNRFDWGNPLSIVVVNLNAWEELSLENRNAIKNLALEFESRFWEISKDLDQENLTLLEEGGMKIAIPDSELRKEIFNAGERIRRKYLETAGKEARTVVEEFLKRVGR